MVVETEDHLAIKIITEVRAETGNLWTLIETHHHRCKIEDLLPIWVDLEDQVDQAGTEDKVAQEDPEECHQAVNHRTDHLVICLQVECLHKTDHPQETCLQIRII